MVELLITDAEAAAIWKRVSGYKDNALIRLYKRDVSEFLADRKTLLAEVSRLTLALAECEMARVVVIGDPQQVDANVYWAALDPLHASYAATEAALEATAGSSLLLGYGQYEVAAGANGYLGLNIVGPFYGLNGLSINASGVCRDLFNYACSRNPSYAATTNRTNQWGDEYQVWGIFLEAPQRLPTTGEDRRLAQAKGTYAGATIYVAKTGIGAGDGTSYLNAKTASTVDTRNYDLVVWCGDISCVSTDSVPVWYPKTGTSGARTIWVSHPTDRDRFLGLAYASWTDDNGAWYTGAISTSDNGYVTTTQGDGVVRALTRVASVAACKALADSYFLDSGATRTYVNLADDSNPATTTFFEGGYSVRWNDGATIAPSGGKSYFDWYGLKFYHTQFSSVFHYYASNWRFYGCEFRWAADPDTSVWFGVTGRGFSTTTGQYIRPGSNIHDTPDIPDGRELNGCILTYATSGFYDTGFLENPPTNTVVRDCYFYGIGHPTDFGSNILATSDSHTVASQGSFDTLTVRNNVAVQCCPQNYVIYNFDGGHFNRNTTLHDGAIINGDFSAALAGTWTDLSTGGGSVALAGGKCELTVGGGTAAIEQAITVGAAYLKISGASFTVAGNVLTLSGTPDLSNLVTSGDNQSYIITSTGDANNTRVWKITAFNDGADTVTISPTPTGTLLTGTWSIARSHFVKFTIQPGLTIKVAVRTASGLAGGSAILAATTVTANETSGVAAIAFQPTVSPYYLQFICDSGTHSGVQLDDVTLPTNLASEPGFATSLPAAKVWFDPVYNVYYVAQRARNISFIKNLVRDPTANPTGSREAFGLTGDITYGYAGQQSGILFDGNRVEDDTGGRFAAGFRVKWQLGSPYDQTQITIRNNVTRGVEWGFYSVASTPNEAGTLTDVSAYVHHNDFHATLRFIVDASMGNPAAHNKVYDFNTFRNNLGALWQSSGGTTYATLPLWNAAAPSGDTFDTNSTHVALGA